MYWFLNSYARTNKYVSEIRRRDPTTALVVPAPLIEAVAIEASWAGVTFYQVAYVRSPTHTYTNIRSPTHTVTQPRAVTYVRHTS